MFGINAVWGWITKGTAYFIGALGMAMSTLVGKVLATLGLTMISLDVVLPNLKAFVLQYATGMSPEAMNFLGAIGLGKAISLVFSALSVKFAGKVFFVPTAKVDAIKGMMQ